MAFSSYSGCTAGFQRNREPTFWRLGIIAWTNELEPKEKSRMILPANDDIARQTFGAFVYGLIWSVPYNMMCTVNTLSEWNRYQGAFWHQHRWALQPGSHGINMMIRNSFTVSGMFASFALFDSVAARVRGREDLLNGVIGGIGAGAFLGTLRGVYSGYVGWCAYAGFFLAMKRIGINEDTAGKLKFDENGYLYSNAKQSHGTLQWL